MMNCLRNCKSKCNFTNSVDVEFELQEEIELFQDKILISRPVFTESNFKKLYPENHFIGVEPIQEAKKELVKNFGHGWKSVKNNINNRLPCIKWIKNYNFKECLVRDILAGLIVGCTHIPQGMAYANLATLPAVYGLYVSFFPVIIFWLFTSSRHNSMGTFSLVAFYTANALANIQTKYIPPLKFNATANSIAQANNKTFIDTTYFLSDTNVEAKVLAATAIAFWVGVVHILMFIGQLGFITQYFSEPFIKSFTCAYSIHIFTSQLKNLFGLPMISYNGIFKIPKTYINFFSILDQTNGAAIIISIICITILFIIKIHVSDRFARKLPSPIPIEIIIVIFGTIISYYGNFKTKFNLPVVGTISAGLPKPSIPPLGLITELFGDVILIAVLSYAVTFSLADNFARKHNYKINSSQELLAIGVSNLFASFFSCFVGGASLARSCVQDASGGKTQVVSIVSSILVAIVLLFLGPSFYSLPQAVLGSIITVAVKGSVFQLFELPYYWRTNKLEFIHFVLTFLSTLLLDLDYGFYIGIGYYILINLVRQTLPYVAVLGNLKGTELYKDVALFKDAQELKNIKIIRMSESLHYSNSNYFVKKIYELTDSNPQDFIVRKAKIDASLKKSKENEINNIKPRILKILPEFIQIIFPCFFKKYREEFENNARLIRSAQAQNEKKELDVFSDEDYAVLPKPSYNHVIIDCSGLSYIDTYGAKALNQLIKDFKQMKVKVFLSECNDAIIDRFKLLRKEHSNEVDDFIPTKLIHLTVHDATMHAFEDSKKNFKNFNSYSVNGGFFINKNGVYPLINRTHGLSSRASYPINNLTRYY